MPVSASLRACAAVTLGAWFAAAPLTGQSGAPQRRMADLWRRSRQHPLRAARPDHARQLQRPRDRVAVQDRQPGPEAGVQLPVHAPHGQREALHDGRLPARRRVARPGHRGDAVDAQRARRRARRGGAPAAVRPRAGLLERREGRADPVRDTGLPPDRARREDRRPGCELRHARRRGPEAGQRPGDRPRHRRGGMAGRAGGCREHDHHRGGASGELRAEEQDERQGLRAGLRRADRQAVLDLPHDSAPR